MSHTARKLAVATIGAAIILPTAPAHATDPTVTVTARWLVPAGYTEATANRVTQTLLDPDQAVPCGRLAQVDTMVGTQAEIDAVMADGLLESGEDRHVTKSWTWEYGKCEAPKPKPTPKPTPKPKPKLVTENYQVDHATLVGRGVVRTYLAADDDRRLGFRELRSLFGKKGFRERHEFVTIKVPANATNAQRIKAINAKTKGGDVRTTTRAAANTSKLSITYAWRLDAKSWRDSKGGSAQLFFARS